MYFTKIWFQRIIKIILHHALNIESYNNLCIFLTLDVLNVTFKHLKQPKDGLFLII